METDTESSRKIKSDLTLISIIRLLKNTEGMSITEIANELDLAKSTVHAHVHTLADEGYLIKKEDKFQLSLQLLDLGGAARNRYLDELIREKVDMLAIETKERAQFVVEERGTGVHLYCSYGKNAVQTKVWIGRHFPLHISAAGKAILANLPEERRDSILQKEPVAFTDQTITDVDTLRRDLQQVRKNNYALNQQESTRGLRAVGVPIKKEDDDVLGAISISGPTHRIKDEVLRKELPDLLLGVVNEIELKMTFR